jgi:hypothetical protein
MAPAEVCTMLGPGYHIQSAAIHQEIFSRGLDKINIMLNNINVTIEPMEGRVNYLHGRRPVRHAGDAR